MRRRTVLKALTGATIAVSGAGCLGGRDGTAPTQTTAGTCPASDRPAPACGDGWKRVNAYADGDVRLGTAAGFELTAEPETLAVGDCVTFRLTNRSDEPKVTGIQAKYDVHRETADGWRSVLFTESRAYEDLGVRQKPGEGFVWRRRLSRAGLSVESDGHAVRACEPLRPGTYRFVYWGVGDGFDALGVEFEVRK